MAESSEKPGFLFWGIKGVWSHEVLLKNLQMSFTIYVVSLVVKEGWLGKLIPQEAILEATG